MRAKYHCAIIFLDQHKAFHKVWHKGVINKMIQINCPDSLTNLVSSYLSDRRFKARVASSLSTSTPITSGVPQGIILGHTLFTIFVNDLPRGIGTDLALFADDTASSG